MIRKIGLITKGYRHIHRYREIISVLVKYGFEDLVQSTNLEKYLDFGKKVFPWIKADSATISTTRWERVRLACEELGPTFIKFGQIMSTRPDLLPQDLILEFEKLQSSVTPFSSDEAVRLVEGELGKPISELFKYFDKNPIATASIGQVHKATMHDDYVVAVKIQRPRIEDTIEVDLEIMLHFATLMEKYIEGMEIVNPVAIVEEFAKTITEELNFVSEAQNIEKFSNYFQKDRTVYIPKVYKNLSTRTILTTEFIYGLKLSNLNQKHELDQKLLAQRGAKIVLKQIFDHGFFHADPHAGNIMFLPENIICLLDFGMVGSIPPAYRDHLATLLVAALRKDTKRVLYAIKKLSLSGTIENKEKLELELYGFLNQYASLSLDEINVAELLNRLIGLLISFKLKISPVFYMLLKALITTENVAKRLDPDFKMIKHIEPMAKKLIREHYNPTRIAKDMVHSAGDLATLAKDLPNDAREIIDLLKRGKLEITLEHKGLNSALSSYDKTSNKIIMAIVLASLIISSSLILHSGIQPLWNGMSVIGIAGFSLSTVLGLGLLMSIVFKK